MKTLTVADLTTWMQDFAPLHLAESWDNVGLLWGDPATEVHKVMTCLTVTPESTREAIDEGANLVISHHPVLFRPIQKLSATRGEGAMLWELAKAGIAIYSPHTAFDNSDLGINQGIANRLNLRDIRPLSPSPERSVVKITTFTPVESREGILAAAFAHGAGQIGRYSECSFTTGGRGTFFGDDSTHPAVGQAGRRENVREWKLEFVCDEHRLDRVLEAVRAAHPYEEPAIDVVVLKGIPSGFGIGRVGSLPGRVRLIDLAKTARSCLSADAVQIVGEPSQEVERVAIMCGAGDGFLTEAKAAGADVLLTGEARFHRGLEAKAMGLGLIVVGHHASERPGVEDLAERIAQNFPSLSCWASRREEDPFSNAWAQKKPPVEPGDVS